MSHLQCYTFSMTKGRPSRRAALQDSITTCRARVALMPDRLRTERETKSETGLARPRADGANRQGPAKREHRVYRPIESKVEVHVGVGSFAVARAHARIDRQTRRRVRRERHSVLQREPVSRDDADRNAQKADVARERAVETAR